MGAMCPILNSLSYNFFKGICKGGSCSRVFLVFLVVVLIV
jgi:hypothetical protein